MAWEKLKGGRVEALIGVSVKKGTVLMQGEWRVKAHFGTEPRGAGF